MRIIISLFLISLFFVGCGGGSYSQNSTTENSANIQNGNTPETNGQDKSTHAKNYSLVPKNDGSFEDIKNLLALSKAGEISGVKYICVGDSTRAISKYNGEHLFYEIRSKLYEYRVNSILLARPGHTAKEFLDGGNHPTWQDVVSQIDGDGRKTIVDISLGINDVWEGYNHYATYIYNAIQKIRAYKPNVHFMLTMPDRIYNSDDFTNMLRDDYIALSRELSLPLNNVIDDLMPTREQTPYSWYRDDGFNVHLSMEGQHVIAQYILRNMLP